MATSPREVAVQHAPGGQLEQAAAPGDRDGLGAAGGAELGQDVGHVHADGLGADEQLVADLAVAAALGDQREHLLLASGERLVASRRRTPRLAAPPPGPAQDPQLGEQRLGTERRRRLARRGRPARRPPPGDRPPCSTAASRARDRATSKTWPKASNADTAARQASTSSSSGGRVDAGQPAQPGVLGAHAGGPGPALGALLPAAVPVLGDLGRRSERAGRRVRPGRPAPPRPTGPPPRRAGRAAARPAGSGPGSQGCCHTAATAATTSS